ncbi:hypothetical protein DYB28_010470, partial [Aphanomyces astaci]
LFGVHPTVPAHPWLSALGIVFMLASIVVYGMVQPKLSNHVSLLTSATRSSTDPLVDVTAVDETTPLKHKDHSPASSSDSILDLDLNAMANENLTESFIHPELPNYGWTLLLSLVSHTIHLFLGPFSLPAEVPQHVAIANAEDERKRKYIGVALALLLGGILGNCLTPYVLWQQSCTAAGGCNPLNFLFSQCMGIYVTSTVCFLIYASFFRYHKRSMPRSAMRPAYVSGLLWATGLAGQLLSAGNLGFDLVYPLTSIGPAMVSMLWSAIYFKEIEGKRNMSIMALGTAMIFTGTLLRAVAA